MGSCYAIATTALALVLTMSCSREEDFVPKQFSQRPHLSGCGTVTVEAPRLTVPAAKTACMGTARRSGLGAELVVHAGTSEGDAITKVLRYERDGLALQVWTDWRDDPYASSFWTLSRCNRIDLAVRGGTTGCDLIRRWR